MTTLEKLERMETCVYCMNGDCLLGYDAPRDCGDCFGHINVWHDEKEVDGGMDVSNVQIYVPANELWSFYHQNIDRCKNEMVLVAENTDTEYSIYITDEDDTLMLSVCKGDSNPEYEEYAMNADDCTNTAEKLLLRYLVPFTIVNGKAVMQDSLPDGLECNDEPELSRQDIEDEIYERNDELDLAMKDFLAVVLQEPDSDEVLAKYNQDFIDEVLDDILCLLAEDYCCEIFRPMFLVDEETGCEIYTQYPYEEENCKSNGSSDN